MMITVRVQKCVRLWWLLSTALLQSVSAGGAYCAKTARARAAALGLDYPGVHGAPDLSSPASASMHSKIFKYDNLANVESNVNSFQENRLVEAHFDHPPYKPASPRDVGGSMVNYDPYAQASSGHKADQMLQVPQDPSVSRSESMSEELKHVAPPTLYKAPSHTDPRKLHEQGRRKQPLFIHREHDPAGDGSAPTRRGKPFTGSVPLLSRGRPSYQSVVVPKREAPILGYVHLLRRGRGRAPVQGLWKMVRRPLRPAQYLDRRVGGRPLVQGNAIFQGLRKTK